MTFKRLGSRRVRAVVFATLLAAGLIPAALAHSHPVSYDPAPNAKISAPSAVTIHFTGALEPKFSSIKVTDAKGHLVNSAVSQVSSSDPKVMTVVLPKVSPGIYTVHWVSVSVDGHRMEGSYTFTVKE